LIGQGSGENMWWCLSPVRRLLFFQDRGPQETMMSS